MFLTYKFRIKDKHAVELNRQARAVNYVWNFCEETQRHALKWGKKWPSGYDLQKLTSGASEEIGLHAHTIQRVCSEYEKSRRTHKKRSLKWRGRKSLGWVPFNTGHVTNKNGAFYFRRQRYDVWLSRELPKDARIGAGSFNQDAKGNWYINCPVEVEDVRGEGTTAIGIDLGLKSLAVMSDGDTVEAQRFYRDMEPALAVAQRAGNKNRVKAIHAKISNRRKDHLHKLSTRLVRENAAIFVGNVNASGLAKTKMAKSVLDAGWSAFRAMLEYKAIRHQVLFEEVNEAWSTQTCHECASIAGPKGQTGLNEREWDCKHCGAHHSRDVNAAINIRARGLARLAGETQHV
jgi:putative transposase